MVTNSILHKGSCSPNVDKLGGRCTRSVSALLLVVVSGVDSVPVMTSLQSTPSVGQLLSSLHQHAVQLDLSRLHKFTDAGLEADEWKESLDTLLSLAHNYEEPSDMERT